MVSHGLDQGPRATLLSAQCRLLLVRGETEKGFYGKVIKPAHNTPQHLDWQKCQHTHKFMTTVPQLGSCFQ